MKLVAIGDADVSQRETLCLILLSPFVWPIPSLSTKIDNDNL